MSMWFNLPMLLVLHLSSGINCASRSSSSSMCKPPLHAWCRLHNCMSLWCSSNDACKQVMHKCLVGVFPFPFQRVLSQLPDALHKLTKHIAHLTREILSTVTTAACSMTSQSTLLLDLSTRCTLRTRRIKSLCILVWSWHCLSLPLSSS